MKWLIQPLVHILSYMAPDFIYTPHLCSMNLLRYFAFVLALVYKYVSSHTYATLGWTMYVYNQSDWIIIFSSDFIDTYMELWIRLLIVVHVIYVLCPCFIAITVLGFPFAYVYIPIWDFKWVCSSLFHLCVDYLHVGMSCQVWFTSYIYIYIYSCLSFYFTFYAYIYELKPLFISYVYVYMYIQVSASVSPHMCLCSHTCLLSPGFLCMHTHTQMYIYIYIWGSEQQILSGTRENCLQSHVKRNGLKSNFTNPNIKFKFHHFLIYVNRLHL